MKGDVTRDLVNASRVYTRVTRAMGVRCACSVRAVCVQCAFGVRLGFPMIGCVRNKGPIMWGTVRKLMKPGMLGRESASEYIIIL